MAAGACGSFLIIGVEVGALALITGIILAAIPVPIYLALALLLDRYEPEPLPLLVLTFLWGAGAATIFALIVNSTGQALVSGAFGSDFGELFGATISAPVVEETAKATALFAIYKWRRFELDGVLDGIIYAAMVGLGFAFTENVLYYSKALAQDQDVLAGTFFARGILSPFAHPLFTAITGIGFGLAARSRSNSRGSWVLVGLLGAIILHALWNSSASAAQGAGFLGVYALIMFPTFVVVLVLAIVARAREGKTVRERLGPELASGVLGPYDLEALGSMGARRRAIRAAGPASKARKHLYRSAVDLAFLRRQLERVPDRLRPRLTQEEAETSRRVWELSWRAAGREPPPGY
jgi:protease PrsW